MRFLTSQQRRLRDCFTMIPMTNFTTITTDFDLYREVHKGIRHALFHTTMRAGRVDPIDEAEVTALLATHETLIELMTNHHHHEDDRSQPFIERHGGTLAATVLNDHHRIEGQMGELDLVSLTSLYLTHQALEEEQVMPALRAALPVD